MPKFDDIKLSKKGCIKKHPVRDASLGRTVNIILSCIPLGMYPYGMQKDGVKYSTGRRIPAGCKERYTLVYRRLAEIIPFRNVHEFFF
jgi:hypothetical protein